MKTDSKSVCFDVFNHIVKNHNTTHHNTIKIKLIDVKSNSYAEFNVGSNKNTVSWTFTFLPFSKVPRTFDFFHLINDLTVKKLLELFTKKNCRRLIKQDLE